MTIVFIDEPHKKYFETPPTPWILMLYVPLFESDLIQIYTLHIRYTHTPRWGPT